MYRSGFRDALAALGVAIGILVVVGFIVMVVGLIANQGGHDFTGAPNHFVIEATVTGTTSESVLVKNIHVVDARGAAVSWFKSAGNIWSADHSELQDNYTDGHNTKHADSSITYGSTDIGTDLVNLIPGMRVRVWGTISDTKTEKSTQTRARFWKMEVLPGSF